MRTLLDATTKTALSLAYACVLSISIVSCRASDSSPQCPAAFVQDEPRANRLWKRLGEAHVGDTRLRQNVAKPRVCFGQTELSSITTDGIILFDDKLDESEGTARLGHLFDHFVNGMPMAHPKPQDCETQVDEALRAEAAALSIELQLRREFGVTKGRIAYEFEPPYWAAIPEARERLIFDYLRAHPNGAPGIDALAAGYAKRCRESIKP